MQKRADRPAVIAAGAREKREWEGPAGCEVSRVLTGAA